MADSNSSFKNWFLGILGTIITAVIIWWLTGPLSPFTPKGAHPAHGPKQIAGKKANVVIASFNIRNPINIGETTMGKFEITDNGNAAAFGCQLEWETPGLNGTKTSNQFDLQPGETKSLQLISNAFPKPGTFATTARLTCNNANDVTESKSVVVNFSLNTDATKIIRR